MANAFLTAERDRWPLWLPVLLGAGSGLYFALPSEPAPVWGWVALAAGLVAAAVAVLGLKSDLPRWPLGLAAALLLGFGVARLNELRASATSHSDQLGPSLPSVQKKIGRKRWAPT